MIKVASKTLRGRFTGGISGMLLDYSGSLGVDCAMFLEDVWGSMAHVLMLEKQGIISRKDAKKILSALKGIRKDYVSGRLVLDPALEDVHMNVEEEVMRRCGREYGGKMHTARSRNDQVATDTRMRLRASLLDAADSATGLQESLLSMAEKHAGTLMPGYTHMQHAQPITLGFWASSYASMLERDLDRLKAAYSHVNACPLGAGALAGTSYKTDRRYTARLLGFDSVQEHALDAVGSRDCIAEAMSAFAILMSTLSKLAEDLVLYTSYEFGFLEFSDDFSTGSSIMPQKKNPDLAELVRGKTGRAYGGLVQSLTVIKGTPSGYNRDFQEDRVMLWDTAETVSSSLQVLAEALKGMKVDSERMSAPLYCDFSNATELANLLVRKKGAAFRDAYKAAGETVRELSGRGKNLSDTETVKGMLSKKGFSVSIEELEDALDPAAVAGRNRSLGGTSPSEVSRMVKALKGRVASEKKWVFGSRKRLAGAFSLTEKAVGAL